MNGEGIDIYRDNQIALRENIVLMSEIRNSHEEFLYNLKRLGVSKDVEKAQGKQKKRKNRNKRNYYKELRQDRPAWFDKKTGGYYIMQQGHEYGRGTRLEVEAAKLLASLGHKVILQPEGDGKGGISFRLNRKGNNGYSEGTIDSIYYEQFSSPKEQAEGVFQSVDHGHEKGVSTALLYNTSPMPLTDEVIKEGLKQYRDQIYSHTKTVKFLLILRKTKKRPILQKWSVNGFKIR